VFHSSAGLAPDHTRPETPERADQLLDEADWPTRRVTGVRSLKMWQYCGIRWGKL